MKVIVRKLPNHKTELICARDDGSVTRGKGVPGMGASTLPHDLIHFIVEMELGLTRGVYGLIASGKNLAEIVGKDWMEYARKSAPELLISEAVVHAFQRERSTEPGSEDDFMVHLQEACETMTCEVPEIDDATLARIRASLDAHEKTWSIVLEGESLDVVFETK